MQDVGFCLHQEGPNLGKTSCPLSPVTIRLDAQFGTPYPRSAGFDTDIGAFIESSSMSSPIGSMDSSINNAVQGETFLPGQIFVFGDFALRANSLGHLEQIESYAPGCNAPDPMRQVSASYSPSLPCHLLACCTLPCHHLHFISCHHVHRIRHTCSSHASELFPRCPFCNPALLRPPASPFTFLRVRVLNFLGMDRGLTCGLGLLPVDRLSSFVSFGVRLILQRLTG